MQRGIGIFGFGSVGRVLADQAQAIGCVVSVVADSSGAIVASEGARGIPAAQLKELASAKESGKSFKDVADVVSPKEGVQALEKFSRELRVGLADTSAFSGAAKEYVS